jgi:DNA polymerase elongation subunit (family B)
MFSNIYFNQQNSKIYLWENKDGKKNKLVIDVEREYYIPDSTKKSPIVDVFGTPMILQKTKYKKSIKELQESGVYTCEGDLSEEVKFLHKKYGQEDNIMPVLSDINIAFFDIEIAIESEFPKPEEAKYPINLITIKFSKNEESYTFGLQDYTGNVIKNYFYCADEKRLLEAFIAVFRKKKPDILTGWNINYVFNMTDGFDIPYLLNRCRKLNVDYTHLSPINIVEEKQNTGWYIAGVSILDYLSLYKKFQKEKLESYSLNFVGIEEIKEGKLDFDGSINTLYKTNWNKFVEYNNQDVELVEKIDKKLKYIELAITMCYNSLVPFDRIYSSIAVLQGHIIKELRLRNMVLPDRSNNEPDSFPGAYVFAKEGAYDNVISWDIESLYPHIIISYNISPETLVLPEETDKIERLKQEGKLILSPVGRSNGFMYEDNNVKFDNIYYDDSKKGILPIVVKKIFDERKKYKQLAKECKARGDIKGFGLNDRLQYTKKILANSLYGVIANPNFCLYNIKNAMAITLGGQDLIQFLSSNGSNYLMQVGYRGVKIKKDPLILVDTDSSYYCLSELFNKTKKENETFLDWCKALEDEVLTKLWKKLIVIHSEKYNAHPVINFVRDLITRKFIILAKKKYVFEILDKEGYTYPEPKIDYKGVEIVRKDTPLFCRNKFLDIIKLIFESGDRLETLKRISDIQKSFNREDIMNIAITKGITDYNKYAKSDSYYEQNGLSYPPSCPIHVRAAINYNYMNKKYNMGGMPIYSGTKMKFIHIAGENELHQDCIGFVGSYPTLFLEKFKIDYEKQFERTFQNIIERFFIVLGWGKINISSINLNKFIEF